jgi:hypothetical protein
MAVLWDDRRSWEEGGGHDKQKKGAWWPCGLVVGGGGRGLSRRWCRLQKEFLLSYPYVMYGVVLSWINHERPCVWISPDDTISCNF